MTLQEERAALQKRMDEIDAEIAGFVPGWYACWNVYGYGAYIVKKDTQADLQTARDGWQNVEPFHLVAHKFLPEGWKVLPPEAGTLYDWSQAPEWANYGTTGEQGECKWHERNPGRDTFNGTGFWWSNDGKEDYMSDDIPPSVPWDQSLEQRPGITQ